MSLTERLRWQLRHHPALPWWIALWIWVPAAFRVSSSTGISTAGLLDDLLLLAGAVLYFAFLERTPSWFRTASLFLAALPLVGMHLSTLVFFRFFRAFIVADTLSMAGQAADTLSIVEASLNRTDVAVLLLAPCLLLLATTKRASSYGRRPALSIALPMAFALIMLPTYRATIVSNFFVAAENNPLTYLIRDYLADIFSDPRNDVGVSGMELVARRDETYHRTTAYRWAHSLRYPILKFPIDSREAPSFPPRNVVLILLESVRGFETGLTGLTKESEIAPNLSRLRDESLAFPNLYFNAMQTAPAEIATLCSILPDPTMRVLYLSAPNVSVACLPEILQRFGYSTAWINSYRADFTNRDVFLSSHGFSTILAEEQLRSWGPRRPPIGWGIADEDLFDFALAHIEGASEPFFVEILTLSNHAPRNEREYPIRPPASALETAASEEYQRYLLGTYYTDYALGRFLVEARQRPWFRNTVFVILGDHGMWTFPNTYNGAGLSFLDKMEIYTRGGMLIWAPALIEPGRSDVVGSQIDVAPTILDLLGIVAPNAFQGVSLLADEVPREDRFAIFVGKSSWNIRIGSKYCYALGQSCFESGDPRCPPDVTPGPQSHSCFRPEGDVLPPASARSGLVLLDDPDRSRLLTTGRRLLNDTTFLVQNDSFFPKRQNGGVP